MKKLIFLSIVLSAIFVSSCTKTVKDASVTSDSTTVVVDSLSVDSVSVDSPKISKGDNPDIMFNYNDKKWGIACKVPHTKSAKTFIENFYKGIEQIENSESEIGFVVFNMKNVIPHDELWPILNYDEYKLGAEPIFGGYKEIKAPLQKLKKIGDYY